MLSAEMISLFSALLHVGIFYLSLVASYFTLKYFARVGDLLVGGGKFIVFGIFAFSVASFFAYFEFFRLTDFPLVVEFLYMLSLMFVVVGFKMELENLKKSA